MKTKEELEQIEKKKAAYITTHEVIVRSSLYEFVSSIINSFTVTEFSARHCYKGMSKGDAKIISKRQRYKVTFSKGVHLFVIFSFECSRTTFENIMAEVLVKVIESEMYTLIQPKKNPGVGVRALESFIFVEAPAIQSPVANLLCALSEKPCTFPVYLEVTGNKMVLSQIIPSNEEWKKHVGELEQLAFFLTKKNLSVDHKRAVKNEFMFY